MERFGKVLFLKTLLFISVTIIQITLQNEKFRIISCVKCKKDSYTYFYPIFKLIDAFIRLQNQPFPSLFGKNNVLGHLVSS